MRNEIEPLQKTEKLLFSFQNLCMHFSRYALLTDKIHSDNFRFVEKVCSSMIIKDIKFIYYPQCHSFFVQNFSSKSYPRNSQHSTTAFIFLF